MTLCYNKEALFHHSSIIFHVQTSCYSPADAVLPQSVSAALPARYMQTIENAAVWAQIGDKMVTVGNIRAETNHCRGALPQVITYLILALAKVYR